MPTRSVLARDTFPGWLLVRQERMAEGTALDWCVADAASDRALGSVTVFSRSGPMTGDAAELGYQLFPSARGRGVAKTAARLATRHAFTAREEGGLGLRRLVAETAADNDASNAVLRATGFTSWGREHAVDELPDGSLGDGLHWELFRDAWLEGPGAGSPAAG
jgi:RimJ/RimL family protein N-acetyltransferase